MLERPPHVAAFGFQRASKRFRPGNVKQRGHVAARGLLRFRGLWLRLGLSPDRNPMSGWAQIVTRVGSAGSALWQWLRGASGEHAYECYLHHAEKHADEPLTAEQFYLDNID